MNKDPHTHPELFKLVPDGKYCGLTTYTCLQAVIGIIALVQEQ